MTADETETTAFDGEVRAQAWRRVDSLSELGPDDRCFTVRTDEAGRAVATFGDGIHGRRLPDGVDAVVAAYRTGSGPAGNMPVPYVSVRLQAGRVQLDADWSEPTPPGRLCALYRGVVVDNVDPLLRRRLRILVPDALGQESAWAVARLTSPDDPLPTPGDGVWVMFEAGDVDRPVWLGLLFAV